MICSNCGHELPANAKFCSNCGAPVSAGASAAPADQPPDEPPVHEDAPADASHDETPAERRERERREDFERAWGGSAASATTAPRPPHKDDSGGATDATAGSSADTATESGDGFATRRATWEVERDRLQSDDADDEWSMSSLGPPPKPSRRRTWLWILLGIIAAFVIACCVFSWWLTTDSGLEWFEGIATQAAEEIQQATDEAATPQP